MISALVAVRDFLIALALAWVGVTIQAPAPPAIHQQQPAQRASTPACSDGQLCSAERPHFDALNCDER